MWTFSIVVHAWKLNDFGWPPRTNNFKLMTLAAQSAHILLFLICDDLAS